jgi:hypothetical protein
VQSHGGGGVWQGGGGQLQSHGGGVWHGGGGQLHSHGQQSQQGHFCGVTDTDVLVVPQLSWPPRISTLAELVCVAVLVVVAVKLNVMLSPTVRLEMSHVIVLPLTTGVMVWPLTVTGVATMPVRPALRVSVTTTLSATFGPSLSTVSEKLAVECGVQQQSLQPQLQHGLQQHTVLIEPTSLSESCEQMRLGQLRSSRLSRTGCHLVRERRAVRVGFLACWRWSRERSDKLMVREPFWAGTPVWRSSRWSDCRQDVFYERSNHAPGAVAVRATGFR